MGKKKTLAGESVGDDNPDWKPLEQLAATIPGHFMWMFAVELEDGRRLEVYKHIWTRHYLHLDSNGAAFAYTGDDSYLEVDPDEWLHAALGVHPPPWKPRPSPP